jgi:hypothetical protein
VSCSCWLGMNFSAGVTPGGALAQSPIRGVLVLARGNPTSARTPGPLRLCRTAVRLFGGRQGCAGSRDASQHFCCACGGMCRHA